MIDALLKKGISRLVRNDVVWTCLDATVLRISRYAEQERRNRRIPPPPATSEAIRAICPDLRVRHGVFKGLRYPEPAATGSTLFPKLLGSYERELHPILETICATPYKHIVDIGCAEGYYAVGLATRIPGATVYAFDTNEDAVQLCRQLADMNGVGSRVRVEGFCSADTLRSLPLSGKTLVISDCEGYEKELFTDSVVAALARHDILIELHDFIDISISMTLRRRFEKSHEIETIQSVHDIKKAQEYAYEELSAFDLPTRRQLLGEYRPATMEWFFMRPRCDADTNTPATA